jgi:hypothetical protein
VPTEVDVLAVVNNEVLSGTRIVGALVSTINNQAQKVIVGSVYATVAAIAAASAACNIKYE